MKQHSLSTKQKKQHSHKNKNNLTCGQSQFSNSTSESFVIFTVSRSCLEPSWLGKNLAGARRRFAIFGTGCCREIIQSLVILGQLTSKGFQPRGCACDYRRGGKESPVDLCGLDWYSEHDEVLFLLEMGGCCGNRIVVLLPSSFRGL